MKTIETRAANAVVDILKREGVSCVFGIPGGPLLPLYDALHAEESIEVILTRHEQAAAYSAFAYARITGKLGVCLATLGPGATNLISGLPVALVSSVPVLAITGQVQTTAYGRGAHQESTGWFRTPNQEAMSAATTKQSATCVEPSLVADYMRHAIRVAHAGRPGPTHLIFPANILEQKIEYLPLDPHQYREIHNRAIDSGRAQALAHRISRARNPLLLVGERALLPDATESIQRLSETLSIPTVTDLACKSAVDEWSPMYLGCMGVLGHKAFDRYLHNHCDLIISIGQTFNEISTLSWDPLLGLERPLIQIDIDPDEIGKAYPVEIGITGHIPTLVERISTALTTLDRSHEVQRAALVAKLLDEFPLFDDRSMTSAATPMLPQRAVSELREALPDNAIVLSDSSKWTRWLGRYFPSRRRNFVTAHDYEPMGWAVAGAIGAKRASPDQPVVCVSGDGAFLMSAMELSTASNHEIDIIWLMMNDQRLGVIYDLQDMLYRGRISSTAYRTPDICSFAGAFGAVGELVDRPGQLTEAIRRALARRGSTVLDVRFDVDEIPSVRPRSVRITTAMGLPKPGAGARSTKAMLKILKEK